MSSLAAQRLHPAGWNACQVLQPGLPGLWLSWKETCDEIGEDELKARVVAGNIEYRKHPEEQELL